MHGSMGGWGVGGWKEGKGVRTLHPHPKENQYLFNSHSKFTKIRSVHAT